SSSTEPPKANTDRAIRSAADRGILANSRWKTIVGEKPSLARVVLQQVCSLPDDRGTGNRALLKCPSSLLIADTNPGGRRSRSRLSSLGFCRQRRSVIHLDEFLKCQPVGAVVPGDDCEVVDEFAGKLSAHTDVVLIPIRVGDVPGDTVCSRVVGRLTDTGRVRDYGRHM